MTICTLINGLIGAGQLEANDARAVLNQIVNANSFIRLIPASWRRCRLIWRRCRALFLNQIAWIFFPLFPSLVILSALVWKYLKMSKKSLETFSYQGPNQQIELVNDDGSDAAVEANRVAPASLGQLSHSAHFGAGLIDGRGRWRD